jgi:hypothetical protein
MAMSCFPNIGQNLYCERRAFRTDLILFALLFYYLLLRFVHDAIMIISIMTRSFLSFPDVIRDVIGHKYRIVWYNYHSVEHDKFGCGCDSYRHHCIYIRTRTRKTIDIERTHHHYHHSIFLLRLIEDRPFIE